MKSNTMPGQHKRPSDSWKLGMISLLVDKLVPIGWSKFEYPFVKEKQLHVSMYILHGFSRFRQLVLPVRNYAPKVTCKMTYKGIPLFPINLFENRWSYEGNFFSEKSVNLGTSLVFVTGQELNQDWSFIRNHTISLAIALTVRKYCNIGYILNIWL